MTIRQNLKEFGKQEWTDFKINPLQTFMAWFEAAGFLSIILVIVIGIPIHFMFGGR